jgi:hypothetical protein
MLAALHEINNPDVMTFFLNYTRTEPSDESTSKQICLPKCYEEAGNKIRILYGKKKQVPLNKATNASGSNVADA